MTANLAMVGGVYSGEEVSWFALISAMRLQLPLETPTQRLTASGISGAATGGLLTLIIQRMSTYVTMSRESNVTVENILRSVQTAVAFGVSCVAGQVLLNGARHIELPALMRKLSPEEHEAILKRRLAEVDAYIADVDRAIETTKIDAQSAQQRALR